MWMKMPTYIRKMASEEFGVIKGGKRETKKTWWWNENVQNTIKEKKECFRRMHLDRSVDNIERYKVTKKTAKRAVSEAMNQMYDGLYQRLGTKKGEKDIYRMTKSRERKARDIIQVKCIKDATERLLTRDEDIRNRWREYFNKLLNEDSGSSSIELDISSNDLNRLKDALKRMTGGKAMGPDGIPIEVWRTLRDVAIVWLTKLFNLIFRSNKMTMSGGGAF
jgi:Leucine-rich repeat (LRR) protein